MYKALRFGPCHVLPCTHESLSFCTPPPCMYVLQDSMDSLGLGDKLHLMKQVGQKVQVSGQIVGAR